MLLNEAIYELYVNHGILTPEFTIDTTPETILKKLTETGIKYTWETIKEEKINGKQSVIEVKVYLPSHILYGRHVYETEADASTVHLYAISNAIKNIVSNADVKPAIQEQPKPVQQSSSANTPLSQEDVLNMMMQQQNQNTDLTTAEQFNNDNREEIPFEDVKMDIEELNNLLSGTTKTQEQPQSVQQSVSHGFTQDQINAINDFKRKMNITNDAMLGNYINSWDNKLSRKEDLNPSNIDSFIQWTQSVGKAPC